MKLKYILDSKGGYMDAKKSKLEEQFAEDALKNPYKQSDLFAGISIFVNGLTTPSAEELKRIMMTHGGIYHTYQRYRSSQFLYFEFHFITNEFTVTFTAMHLFSKVQDNLRYCNQFT